MNKRNQRHTVFFVFIFLVLLSGCTRLRHCLLVPGWALKPMLQEASLNDPYGELKLTIESPYIFILIDDHSIKDFTKTKNFRLKPQYHSLLVRYDNINGVFLPKALQTYFLISEKKQTSIIVYLDGGQVKIEVKEGEELNKLYDQLRRL